MAEITSQAGNAQAEKVQAEKGQAEKHSGRKILIGTVVSNKMQKTIVVEVTRKKAHPMYKRVIAIRKKFYAHDEENKAKAGDKVTGAPDRKRRTQRGRGAGRRRLRRRSHRRDAEHGRR